MIKYFKELENPNDNVLPLYDFEYLYSNKKNLLNFFIPISFYIKYQTLFELMKEINFFIKSGNIEAKDDDLHLKYLCDDRPFIESYESSQDDYGFFIEFEKIQHDYPELEADLNSIILKPYITKSLFRTYYDLFRAIYHLWPERQNNLKKYRLMFENALKDLEQYSSIKHTKKMHPIDVKLPNAWFITPYGDLYNTGEQGGHKETNLIYPYMGIARSIEAGKVNTGIKKDLLEKRQKILNDRRITQFDFSGYLNNCDDFMSLHHEGNTRYAYEPRIVKTVLGVISAQAGLYNFFEKFQRHIKEQESQLHELAKITRTSFGINEFDFRDLLVRAAKFHKVESSLKKTITTSSLNVNQNFSEYLKRGWNIWVIPPIVIDQEKGIIKEIEFTSGFARKLIDKEVRQFQKTKKYGEGNIYYHGM